MSRQSSGSRSRCWQCCWFRLSSGFASGSARTDIIEAAGRYSLSATCRISARRQPNHAAAPLQDARRRKVKDKNADQDRAAAARLIAALPSPQWAGKRSCCQGDAAGPKTTVASHYPSEHYYLQGSGLPSASSSPVKILRPCSVIRWVFWLSLWQTLPAPLALESAQLT